MSGRHIPPITDPMGKSWQQPDLTQLVVDGSYAILTPQEFDALLEYSTTTPSGVYAGKAWRAEAWCWARYGDDPHDVHRQGTGEWFLRWFGIVPDDPKVCSNHRLPIVVVPALEATC